MVRMRYFIGGMCITIEMRGELLPLKGFGVVIGSEKGVGINSSVGD